MNTLMIPYLPDVHYRSSSKDAIYALGQCTAVAMLEKPWSAYPYKPLVHFRIGHTKDSLVLQFFVEEQHIKAEYRNTNDPVHRDSCVEFFISFDGVNYYNLEFNCIGTGFIGYGNADRSKRTPLRSEVVDRVKTHAVINPDRKMRAAITWELLLNIPLSIFGFDHFHSLSGVFCTGNFYKCGDGLPNPHFISWNNIDYPEPNFHLPQFFGQLFFL